MFPTLVLVALSRPSPGETPLTPVEQQEPLPIEQQLPTRQGRRQLQVQPTRQGAPATARPRPPSTAWLAGYTVRWMAATAQRLNASQVHAFKEALPAMVGLGCLPELVQIQASPSQP